MHRAVSFFRTFFLAAPFAADMLAPMSKKTRRHGDDLHGASRLALDATKGIMSLVESMHRTIASGPAVLGKPLSGPARVLTGLVYGGIRGVTDLIGSGVLLALEELSPLLGQSVPGPEREAVLAALNGVLGDYMLETQNPLAITMTLKRGGEVLDLQQEALRAAIPAATGKICVLVHGSSMNDLQWTRKGHDHGAALEKDLGLTAVYVHYNTGLHTSTNGRELATQLNQLVEAWPVPVEELSLVTHSMGGLVARSAVKIAEEDGYAFLHKLKNIVFLGTPHHGAPLERGGNWLDVLLGVSRYSAPLARLGKIRSAGVTDLRYGNVLESDWNDQDRFEMKSDARTPLPLPNDITCFAIAATLSEAVTADDAPKPSFVRRVIEEHLVGDGLVPVNSALGIHTDEARRLRFDDDKQWIAYSTGHLDLLDRADVYEKLRGWLGGAMH